MVIKTKITMLKKNKGRVAKIKLSSKLKTY